MQVTAFRRAGVLAAMAGFALLAGCTQAPPQDQAEAERNLAADAEVAPPAQSPDPAETPPPGIAGAASELADNCDANAGQDLVGEDGTDEAVVERARSAAGAETVRVLRPGQPATMDFRGDRLNVLVDEDGRIAELHCG